MSWGYRASAARNSSKTQKCQHLRPTKSYSPFFFSAEGEQIDLENWGRSIHHQLPSIATIAKTGTRDSKYGSDPVFFHVLD
jgi:hypothetical protein